MADTTQRTRQQPMSEDDFAADLVSALRRVQSMGDLDSPGASTSRRAARRHPTHSHRRSEGQWPPRNGTSPHSRHSSLDHPTIVPFTAPTIVRPTDARILSHHHPSEDWEFNFNFPEELAEPLAATATTTRQPRPVPPGWKGKLLVFLGKAGPNAKERSKLMSFVWTFGSTLIQFVIIVTLLAYSSKHESPTMPGLTEWHACERPLGAWNAVWVVRISLGCLHSYAIWRREVRMNRQYPPESLAEAGAADANRSPATGATNRAPQIVVPRTTATPRFAELQQRERERERERARNQPSHVLTRLGHLVDTLSFVWFLTAHILVYTSVKTCRFAAPHLWWLSFGIMCILYFMVVEVFVVGLIVFIFWPAFWIIWNIGLLITGRHPSQRTRPRHEIGKLSKTAVDQIPLVLYIPPPPEDSKDAAAPATSPDATHDYPPKPKAEPAPKKRRFAFLRRNKKDKGGAPKKTKDGKAVVGEPKTWEDNWVTGEYPFVRLEGNRAACAICLMDFEEPERRDAKSKEVPMSPVDPSVHEVQVEEVTQEDAQRLKLENAGEGPQPLRLLQCGHVFHKTCIDPWLVDVSGRCPICQRAVEVKESS